MRKSRRGQRGIFLLPPPCQISEVRYLPLNPAEWKVTNFQYYLIWLQYFKTNIMTRPMAMLVDLRDYTVVIHEVGRQITIPSHCTKNEAKISRWRRSQSLLSSDRQLGMRHRGPADTPAWLNHEQDSAVNHDISPPFNGTALQPNLSEKKTAHQHTSDKIWTATLNYRDHCKETFIWHGLFSFIC